MIRMLASALLLAAAIFSGPHPAFAGTVDLDAPGALEALAATNPDHYAKVTTILDGVRRQPEATVERWLRVGFDATNVSFAPIVLTSHPAKRRLSFALDVTRYEAVVVLPASGAFVPLR